MKSIFLVGAVVALCTVLLSPSSAAPSSAAPTCKLPSTSCPGSQPGFTQMVGAALQSVQSVRATQDILALKNFFSKVGLDGQCVLYSTTTPCDGLTCDKYLQELSNDFKFLNRLNLHYRNEVCLPALDSTEYLERTVTAEVAAFLDSAVCELTNLLSSPRAQSIGITVDTSAGQASCYDLSTDQFHTALKTQLDYTLHRLLSMSSVCS